MFPPENIEDSFHPADIVNLLLGFTELPPNGLLGAFELCFHMLGTSREDVPLRAQGAGGMVAILEKDATHNATSSYHHPIQCAF